MFDPSAPHIIILLIVVLLLFGSRRLPGAAKSLGESMNIFKKSLHEHESDDDSKPADATAGQGPAGYQQQSALPPATAQQLNPSQQPFDATTHQQQLADLQRQIADLQRQSAGADGSEAQHSQQPF